MIKKNFQRLEFLLSFWVFRRNFLAFWQQHFCKVVKAAFNVSGVRHWHKQCFLRNKNVLFNLLRTLSLNFFLLWATWFWEGCQNCVFCVQCMFMKKNHFENFIFASSFLDFQRKINGFVANSFLKGFSRMHSTCPDERLEEKTSHFSKILYFLSFSHFEPQMFRTNGPKLPGTVVKTVCYVSRGTF